MVKCSARALGFQSKQLTRRFSQRITLISRIPTLISRIPTLIPCIPTLIPHVPTLIPRVPTLISCVPIILLIPFPDSPFRLLQIAAGSLNIWALLANQNNQIIRSIYSIKDTMEQHDFIITKITKNFSQQYDCAMNNTCKIPYFLACQKICRTYIKKVKRKNTQNGQIIHHKAHCFE